MREMISIENPKKSKIAYKIIKNDLNCITIQLIRQSDLRCEGISGDRISDSLKEQDY